MTLAAAAMLVLPLALQTAKADTVWLEGGGKVTGEIVSESESELVVRTKYGATHVIAVEDILKIERQGKPKEEFQKQLAQLAKDDADGFCDLGEWARQRGLEEESQQAFGRAIEIDSEHARAHRALGHKRHLGRWYDEATYKKVVEGLVEYRGKWVTPADKEFLELGFVKDGDGQWVRPEDLARQPEKPREKTGSGKAGTPEKPSSGTGTEGSTRPRQPQPRPTRPLPPSAEESEGDTSWYDDHETSQTWEQAQRKPYKSKYYEIYTNVKPEYAERYGKMLDTYSEKGFQSVFNAKKRLPNGVPKGKIYIYPDQKSFMAAEGMGPSVGGYYQPGQSRVVCYHGRFGMTGTTKTVLIHEATHQFEDYVLPGKMWNCPVWIIEGFAVFFESAKYDPKKNKVIIGFVPRDRLANMKQGVSSGNYIGLHELIRTPQPSFTGFHYAHAWSLIYYMVYGGSEKKKVGKSCGHAPRCKNERRHNQEIFSDLFFLAQSKQVTPADTEALFGGAAGFKAFEEQWKEWILAVPYDFDPRTMDFDDIKRKSK
jgi:hypothetical protein